MKRPRPIKGLKQFVRSRRRPPIQEVVRETTAGGIIYRRAKNSKEIEILLVQDARDRWTIPKGHVEEGETTQETALREIGEETGLKDIKIMGWIGKTNFRYRRENSLVLMVTHVYLAKSLNYNEVPQREDWMNGIKWFPASEAIDAVAYEQLNKLMLVGMKKMRETA
ncbi:NUDIX domain-containing protein [Candidatus Saccharibacteria bacterium]|nr:NUDIX domain-containing protein [Candidatus Saccharibacteria bacterium]